MENLQKDIIDIPFKTKFYNFWFIKNPLCFLTLWVLIILIISISISEYHKNV